MTSPHPDQSAPAADRRRLPYPGDEAITAALHRAHLAFGELFAALGPGRHRLHYAALDVDGLYRLASATVTVTPARRLVADPVEFSGIEVALVAALEGSCTVMATLVVQTDSEPTPRLCGWRIERGWLHGLSPAALEAAVHPCTGSSAPVIRAYAAPLLADPSAAKHGFDQEEERP
ncbi:hypothetical protein [Streptomyces sp. NBC_00648]|uniref:hypothetical protein n=1 Tax=Streptomyces sp. NBC_00648 TaxID=2975797 RepID=UPI00324DD010